MHEPLVPLLVSAVAMLLLMPSSVRGKVVTNANPLTHGLELPLYVKNFVLSCNNSVDTKVDHWEKDNVELRQADEEQLGLRMAQDRSSLTIDNTRRHHEGNYTCVFTNDEKGHFAVKARPEPVLQSEHFVPGTTSLNLVEGASLRLVCKSKLNETVAVRWQMQPEDLSDDPEEVTSDAAFNVFQTAPIGASVATLNIMSVRYSDRAFYICRLDNGVASSDLTILIRVKDKLAALWPFLAIVGEVLILCVVIFIYEKRRPKTELEEDVTISKTSSPAKGAPDVRQRK